MLDSIAKPMLSSPMLSPGERDYPARRKILSALHGLPNGRTMSQLAELVHGAINSSTRSMMSRAVSALLDRGVVTSRIEGRERWVTLTDLGVAQVLEWLTEERKKTVFDSDRLSMPATFDAAEVHSDDRGRAHLRVAAMLRLEQMRADLEHSSMSDADEHYQQFLLALVDEKSDASADAERFGKLVRSWPSDDLARILLSDCAIRYQGGLRRDTMDDLLTVGEQIERLHPLDVLLWSTCALGAAHLNLLEPRVKLDEISARGLVHQVDRLLSGSRISLPQVQSSGGAPAPPSRRDVEFARDYRRGVSSKVQYGVWAMPASATPTTLSQTNQLIDDMQGALMRSIGPKLARAFPGAVPFIRRERYDDAPAEMTEWFIERPDALREVLEAERAGGRTELVPPDTAGAVSRLAEHLQQLRASSDPVVRALGEAGRQFEGICSYLLGVAQAYEHGLDRAALVRNNFWTPEMVAVDIAASHARAHA